ncbi:transcription elongation regulator 1-like protein [Suncus etruscus]|uniref:transcription elongation regulator 1-like protein n=1 Tax=Suncus etruscus TaxID=109475 RepID=UPI00211051A1|nr:transcription elongation regulator 1-like protein [Suncus etruscus]
MLGAARLPRRRRQQQPRLWLMSAEPPPPPPPWLWMVPGSAGLLRPGPGVAPPRVLLASARPPAAPLLPGWPAPGEALLPLLPLPAAPGHAAAAAAAAGHPCALPPGQWLFGGPPPPVGLPPSSAVELVPFLPHICPAALPALVGKSWVDKRIPNCKIVLNNSFALESTWLYPDDSSLFPGPEKPHFLTNQVAVCLSRPAPASRPLPAVVLAPPPIPDASHTSLRPLSRSPAFTIATATAVVSVEPEGCGDPAPPTMQPCRLLTLHPCPSSERSREHSQRPGPPSLVLHTEPKGPARDQGEKEPPSILVPREDSAARGSRPVASTPVPGSPWCVVWTGDDRVFFFNPTMQLSVWEKPGDLQHRGDLIQILGDPPHKRKLEVAADGGPEAASADVREVLSTRTKRNRTDGSNSSEPTEANGQDKDSRTSPQILLPLEQRVAHFRDMLLERGVSAFSTWEKELHKIVFDPRYLLLNSEERRQSFEQFVKTRVKEESKEKRTKLLLARDGFRKLLEESKVSPRTTFKEFADKYGRDQRFRLVQKRKDQEHFFNQFILVLKKRDKENRLRLRKMR